MTNFDKAFDKVWNYVPYYDVVYKNYYNDEMINRVLKLKNIESFLKFLENEKDKVSKEFESLYSKEVLKEVVKLWFEKDNFLNEDIKKLTVGINILLKYMVQRRRITVNEYKKHERDLYEKWVIPLNVVYTGESSVMDIYMDLKKDSEIGGSLYINIGLKEICGFRGCDYFLPLSFLYIDWVSRNVQNKGSEIFKRLEEVGEVGEVGTPGFRERFERHNKIIKTYYLEHKNIWHICEEIKKEYLNNLKDEDKDFMLFGKMSNEDVEAMSLYEYDDNRYEDLPCKLIVQLEVTAMGLMGERLIIH